MADEVKLVAVGVMDAATAEADKVIGTVSQEAVDLRAELDAKTAERRTLAEEINSLRLRIAQAEGPEVAKAREVKALLDSLKAGRRPNRPF